MATDQEIRDAGLLYIPKQKYLQNPYNLPIAPVPPPASGGITNTNAFTNSGGNDFNPAGNAFGYGSPVNEVNVRTFNPQSNDPTGSVANAQTMYNKASNAGPMVETFTGMRPSESVMDYYGGQIMDNKEQYGAQGQYNSPYDDTVDLGYLGRDTSTSIQRNRGTLGKAIDFVTDFIPGVGAVKRGAKFIGGLLPDNPNGPGGGTYGVAGLSDAQKEAYNTLAGDGMLFSGQNGFKTLTGKNFTGKGYMEGQLDMYNKTQKKQGKSFADMDEDEIKALTGFQKKQYLESSALFKEKIATQKAKVQAEKDRQQDLIGTRGTDGRSSSIIQGESGGNDRGTSRASDHGGVGLGHNAGNVRSANAAGTGSAQSYNQHLRSGGRAGYFFGGRVNFKDGGLASIL
jgi:hypothetical protein